MPLIMFLRKKGCIGVQRRCEHRALAITEFDDFYATKMKYYFQCLLVLKRILPLTSHLPSRQPIRYYRLLLAGKKADPDLGSQMYMTMLKAAEETGGKPMIPIQDDEDPEEENEPIAEIDDDVGVPMIPDAPKPKRRKTAVPPTQGTASGSGSAPPPPLTGDPPPICDPSPHDDTDSDINVPVGVGGTGGGGGGGGGHSPPKKDDDSDKEVSYATTIVPRRRRDDGPKWFVSLDGFELRYDPAYTAPGANTSFSPNWQIRRMTHSPPCVKKKHSTASDIKMHGDVGVLAFLYTWARLSPAPGGTRIGTNPTQAQVAEVAAARGEEFRAVLRSEGAIEG